MGDRHHADGYREELTYQVREETGVNWEVVVKNCKIIRGGGGGYHGKQGLEYFAGISAESTGAEGLCSTSS
jgi:uncharacterized RmlC-like cupin family protein